MHNLEFLSWISGIGSFIVAIIGLFLIKPIYKFFNTNNTDKSKFKNNSGKIGLTKTGNNYFNENVTNNVTLNMNLPTNQEKNG